MTATPAEHADTPSLPRSVGSHDSTAPGTASGGGSPQDQHKTVIRPPTRWPGFGLRELWRYRSVALVIARRSLMVRYRQTLVGAAWVLIQPLTMMLVFAVFFGAIMGRFVGTVPYSAYLLSALNIWFVVSRVVSQGGNSIVSGGTLLTKIYFPRADLPIGIAIGAIVDFVFGVIALLLLMLFFGIVPTSNIVFVPLMLLSALATSLGVTFWLAALNAAYRDVEQLLPFLLQVWFFATPIIWSVNSLPSDMRAFLWLNPLTAVVEGMRWAFLGTPPLPPEAWLIGTAMAAVLLVSGYMFFRTREHTFADSI
jgi:lipopolysaccharide transport system permease protein